MLFFILSTLDNEEERLKISEIYEKYRFTCLKIGLKITQNHVMAEDAVHDTFVEIIKQKEKILKLSCSEMKSLIVIIVKHKSIDILRKNKKLSHVNIDELEYSFNSEEKPIEMQIIDKQGFDNLVKHINKLDEIYKITFEMKYISNLSNTEIANELGITLKNVEIRLYRAKLKLRNMIKKEGDLNE